MDWNTIFVGIGAAVIATVVGSLLTVIMTYRFQKRLLDQQIIAQEKSHKELLVILDKMAEILRFT